jgi:hypothetical protein
MSIHEVLPTDFHVPRDSKFNLLSPVNERLKKGFSYILLLFYILKRYLNRTYIIIKHKYPGIISGSQSIYG